MLKLTVIPGEALKSLVPGNMLPAQPLQLHVCQVATGLTLALHATNSKVWFAKMSLAAGLMTIHVVRFEQDWILCVSVLTCKQFLFMTGVFTRWQAFCETRYKPKGTELLCAVFCGMNWDA